MEYKLKKIPQGWEVKKLGEIVELKNGFAFKSNLFCNVGIPIIRIKNIQDKVVILNDLVFCNPCDYKNNLDDYLIKQNDILIAMSGATTGKVGIYDSNEKAYLNQRVGLLRIDDDILRKYIFWFLCSKSEQNLKSAFGAAQPNLSTKQIHNIEIPLPPLEEQMRIVKILDSAFASIDRSIELVKANLANLDELAKSVLDRAFNPLGDSADSTESTQNPSTHDTQSPYPLPQHWEWKSLGEMCKILNGGTPDTKNPVFWDLHQSHEVQTDKSVVGVGGEVERGEGATSQFKPLHPLAKEKSYYWATLVDTKQKYLHSTQRKITQKGLDSSNATLLPVNSVIFSSRASIGEVCIAKVETATNQGYKNFVCDENVLYYEFLYFALQRFAKEIESLAQGTTYKEVSKAKISEFQIPLPKDIKEQEQIAMHLDSVFDKIQKLKELYNTQLQDYEELKQSLLTQAFSGKL